MRLKLLTVAFDPESGGFPTEPMASVEGEVLSVVEHFFHYDGLPHLLLVVHHRPPPEGPRGVITPEGEDLRASMSSEERALFERLRAWRRGRAEAEGVPPYVILSNRQLAEIVRKCPSNLKDLRSLRGIGEAKAKKFGEDLLKMIAGVHEAAPPPTPPEETPDGG